MHKNPIKVLIVDDHPMVRRGLSMFVDGFPDFLLVGEASNVAVAVEIFRREQPNVVLMDLVMPDQDGSEAIQQIHEEDSTVAIIALTSFGEEHLIEAALRAGARGFLYKSVSVDELADAIRQTHRGKIILDAKASDVMQRLVSASNSPTPAPVMSTLSNRENEVLQLLERGLTNKQIAFKLGLQTSTVKQYISNIFSKLHVRSRTEAVATALHLGLIKK